MGIAEFHNVIRVRVSVGVHQHAATLTDDDGRDSGTSKDFDTGARFASPRAPAKCCLKN